MLSSESAEQQFYVVSSVMPGCGPAAEMSRDYSLHDPGDGYVLRHDGCDDDDDDVGQAQSALASSTLLALASNIARYSCQVRSTHSERMSVSLRDRYQSL